MRRIRTIIAVAALASTGVGIGLAATAGSAVAGTEWNAPVQHSVAGAAWNIAPMGTEWN